MIQKLIIAFIGFLLTFHAGAQVLTVGNLRCGMNKDPLGVESMHPLLSWELNSTDYNIIQVGYRILVSPDSAMLANDQGLTWDSKKVQTSASVNIPFNGTELQPAKKYYWKVMVWDNKGNISPWSKVATWQMGLLKKEDWKNAQWIGYDMIPDSMIIVPFAHGRGKKEWGSRKDILPLLRKTFVMQKPVKHATAFVCGLGQFELSINGKRTGDHFLDPGWTQYSKHAQYVGFDITQQLSTGINAIGVMLGNGFYYIPGERYRKLTGAYGYPELIARIVLEFEDGTTEDIISDTSWKWASSPIYFSSVYGGEDYNANMEQEGWNSPNFNDASWKNVVEVGGPAILNAQLEEPVKDMEHFPVENKMTLASSDLVFDLGQNFSGIPSFTVSGNKNDTIRIIPAELLDPQGKASQAGSGGPFVYNYVLKGRGSETWQPRFSYYGFRYLQVKCIPANTSQRPPVLKDIEGIHLRNAVETAGSFLSSNDLFNQTFELINWAIKSNTMSVFTDCPHRERLGWLEQTYLMGNSVQYNFDAASLFKKVIRDIQFAQTDSGMIPTIAPEYVQFEEPFRDSPEWGSAAIILPWYYYQWYGDKQVLSDCYDMMKRYAAYLHSKLDSNILVHGLGDWYDLGPARPGFAQLTPKGVTATATYYYDLVIMQQIAALLGKKNDVQHFKHEANRLRRKFNKKFFNRHTAQYATGSQTANAMALYMNMVKSKYRDKVVGNLVNDIRSRQNALTAGDIGYRYVVQALELSGRSDVIVDMNDRSDVPGYGYQLKQGATALTESWQALPVASNNHFMLGHLMEWFYSGLAGIKQDEKNVGYKNIIIRPAFIKEIDWVKATYHCVYGVIRSEWKRVNGMIELEIEIPVNTTAKVFLNHPSSVGAGSGTGAQSFTVGSGVHKYQIKDSQW